MGVRIWIGQVTAGGKIAAPEGLKPQMAYAKGNSNTIGPASPHNPHWDPPIFHQSFKNIWSGGKLIIILFASMKAWQ
jgi:hypothetical protein